MLIRVPIFNSKLKNNNKMELPKRAGDNPLAVELEEGGKYA